jgi:hypothetical protein
VQTEDASPVIAELGVAGVAINQTSFTLGLIDTVSLADSMDVVVARKAAVAGATITGGGLGRTDAQAVIGIVAHGAAQAGVYLLIWGGADEGRVRCQMAAYAICGGGGLRRGWAVARD